MEMIINSNINELTVRLSMAQGQAMRTTSYWVARLTKYAEAKMKYHAPSRTKRATGKLKESISSEVNLKGYTAEGIAYVPASLGIYQYTIEGGRESKGRRITSKGGATMRFPTANWKKGRSSPGLLKLSYKGYFNFSSVKVGRYKGSHFVKKSYADLLSFYKANRVKIKASFAGSLFFSTSVT